MKRLTALILAVLMVLTAAAAAMGEENRIWQQGDTGEKVTWIQTRLKELEYFESEPTGIFDEKTEEFNMMPELRGVNAQRLYGDRHGNVWVASFDKGLWKIQQEKDGK